MVRLKSDISQDQWMAYYNRSEGSLSLVCSDAVLGGDVEVYTLTGSRVLKSEIRTDNSSYDISSWAEGVYVILINGVKKPKAHQLVIR